MPTVAIIEDDTDFAEILKECLEEDGQNKVIAMLDNEMDALNWLKTADLSELDGGLAHRRAIEARERLLRNHPGTY